VTHIYTRDDTSSILNISKRNSSFRRVKIILSVGERKKLSNHGTTTRHPISRERFVSNSSTDSQYNASFSLPNQSPLSACVGGAWRCHSRMVMVVNFIANGAINGDCVRHNEWRRGCRVCATERQSAIEVQQREKET
jgi:hypothetical protein